MTRGNGTPDGLRMLIVDDDAIFRQRLVRAIAARGIEAFGCENAAQAMETARRVKPHRAVIDLRMPGESGLELLRNLAELDPSIQVVVLTGYGSIVSAVEAVRRGAVDYLSKPADAEQILTAFAKARGQEPAAAAPATGQPPTLARVEWEHIQRTLADCNGNVSEAARKLAIHRRSLQRKLSKLPPLE